MAPKARRLLAVMSELVRPTTWGPMKLTAARRAAGISLRGEDIVPSTGIEVGGKGLMGKGVVGAEVYNAPGRGCDGAEMHVA